MPETKPNTSDVYQQLAAYLDRLPAGFPATQSGVEVQLLMQLFTEQEAQLALHLTLLNERVRVIAYRAGQPREQVARLLSGMAEKGLISVKYREGKPTHYAISQFVIGFWEGQVNRLQRPVVELFEQYAPHYFEQGPWSVLPQLRTIPIHQAIPVTSEVMPYEQAELILRAKSKIAVRNCVCRQERQLVGEGCDSPMEACLSFDGTAESTVTSGVGRFISLEESLALLEQARKAGLVLQPANSQNPMVMCMCCSCCCGVLRQIKKHPQPASLVANAFHVEFHADVCIACAACVDVCPMAALTLASDGTIAFDQQRCIGCGLCVGVCPTQAVQLVRKSLKEQPVPPRSTLFTYIKIGFKRKSWTVFDLLALVVNSLVDRLIAPR